MSINAVYEDSQGNVRESRMDGVDLTTKISIADDFSASVNYAIGDFCYHLGTLYKCTTTHTAGAWNAAHFTATQVCDEIGELKNALIGHVFGSFTPTASSTRGDIATALNAVFSNLSAEDKSRCKIIRNDGYVFAESAYSGNFVATLISDVNLNLQLYAINLPLGKYLGWSSLSTTGADDMSDMLDVEGRTHYLVCG